MNSFCDLPSSLSRKLWFVTGKGGVGKTTVSAALGLLASRRGYKTLLVETHGLSHLGDVFEKGWVGYEPARIQNNLYLVQLTAEQAFEEYVLQQVKFKVLYNAVFNNRYVRHFIDAAPGLNELLTIGKIWSLVSLAEESKSQKGYDLVIVDAPSTGHGLSLLTVAQVVMDAVRVGPLKSKAEAILKLVRDPQKTLTWMVTLPEEMPVNEAVEMIGKLRDEAHVQVGPVLINSVWPHLLSPGSVRELEKKHQGLPLLEVYQKRLSQSEFYIDKLKTTLHGHFCSELPVVYQTQSPYQIAKVLSQKIEEQLSSSPVGKG